MAIMWSDNLLDHHSHYTPPQENATIHTQHCSRLFVLFKATVVVQKLEMTRGIVACCAHPVILS